MNPLPPTFPPSQGIRLGWLLTGLFLFAAFFSLTQTNPGLRISYHPSFSNSSPGEVQFWLAHALFLLPGSILVGIGLAPMLAGQLSRAWSALSGLSPRGLRMAAALLGIVAYIIALVGNAVVLGGFPFTDDEPAARFGGQVLAQGRWMWPIPEGWAALSRLYLYEAEGQVTSFDWLGVQIVWAVAEATGLGGAVVFGFFSALPAPCLALWLGRRLGPQWGVLAGGLFLVSPMAFGLSLTNHAHTVSRGLLAAGLMLADQAERRRGTAGWVVAGLILGMAGLARPLETAALVLPLVVDQLRRILQQNPAAMRAVAGLVLGALPALALYLFHNFQLTGNPLVHARQIYVNPDLPLLPNLEGLDLLWNRFGGNSVYNLLMLVIWFLGPLGVPLVALGAAVSPGARRYGWGVVILLAAGLLHNDHGIHPLGPMHYQECAVPLLVLAVFGLRHLFRRLPSALRPATACALLLACTAGLGVFNFWNSRAMRIQTTIHREIHGLIQGAERQPALVFAPQYFQVIRSVPKWFATSSWVFEWPRPRPDLSDPVLIVRDLAGVRAEVRSLFPHRTAYELRLLDPVNPPHLGLVPLP